MSEPEPVAIVGYGGLLPGGPDVESFWRNVAAGVDAGRSVPAGRWTLSPDKACRPGELVPDKTYSTWGCYLDEIPLSPEFRQRRPDLLKSLDPVCHLALEAAGRATQSSKLDSVDRQRIGVILGHIVLPTEATSAIARDTLLREFEEHVFAAFSQSPPSATAGPWSLRNRRVAALPAELIAECFDFGGTAFTLDAACASSLYAIKLAVDELQAGRADAMLAGGLSRPDCQYTQIGFAQLQALSKQGKCAPLSAAADGLVVGEGAGLFVLKRLSNAIAAGDRIEAVIAGIGLSNDRGANLLAPHSEGQLRAMRAAYEQAGWNPEDVDYIECHATGTPTGDAVELASLHALWQGRPSQPGQCVLGAVKSNVGHLLTGAGGAGLMKVLGMLRAKDRWPIANFRQPAAALVDPESPFRVVADAEPWPERSDRPRRAAINAFGFGGINAHVLIEEWKGEGGSRKAEGKPIPQFDDVVIVGVEASIGPWNDLAAVRERLFGVGWVESSRPTDLPASQNGGPRQASTHPTSYAIEQIEIPVGEFRIPPLELPDMLPQQQLMLQVTAQALDQAGIGRALGDRTGVFLGVSLDPNTTNFHCRWAIAERAPHWAHLLRLPISGSPLDQWITDLQDAFGSPLTPNRVMGNLAAITASRIAREFDIGGPSFTISADEDSGLRAVEVAVGALQRGELDLAIVGAVEFGSDLRAQLADIPVDGSIKANDGAVVFVLKRRADAARDGNTIFAKIARHDRLPLSGPTDSPLPSVRLGYALATAKITHLLASVLSLTEGLDTTSELRVRDRTDGARQLTVPTSSGDSAIVLEETPNARSPIAALGIPERLFAIEGNDATELLQQLDQLQSGAMNELSISEIAARWMVHHPLDAAKRQAIVLTVRDAKELSVAIEDARRALQDDPARSVMTEHVIYEPQPLGRDGKLAFVFPGSGNAFLGMGRELLAAFPGVLRRQHAENEQLRSQLRPDLYWTVGWVEARRGPPFGVIESMVGLEDSTHPTKRNDLTRDHKAMIFGQVSLGTAMCDLLTAFGIRPAASIGYSLGESAALFGLRAWRGRDEMLERMRRSSLFGSDLVYPFDAARQAWGAPVGQPVPWVSGVINAPPELVQEIVSRKSKVYLLIVNTPSQCVIGGDEQQLAEVVRQLSATFVPFNSPSTVHCPILNEVRRDYLALHRMETTPPDDVDVYSSATGERYGLSRDAAAGAILAQAVDTVDFPRVIRNAYRDGVRLFLEIGPGNSCTRMIEEILHDDPQWAAAICPATSDPVGQFLGIVARLIAHRVPVDLSPLFSKSELRRLGDRRQKIITPVGPATFKQIPLPSVEKAGAGVRGNGSAGVENGSQNQRGAGVKGNGSVGVEIQKAEVFHPPTPAPPYLRTASAILETANIVTQLGSMLSERAEAHAAFLRFASRSQELAARLITGELNGGAGVREYGSTGVERQEEADVFHSLTPAPPHPHTSSTPPRSLDYRQCLAFAIGKIGDVLGPKFAAIDEYPTRVRLPDEPLMLCHRILEIDGEPLSMTHGRVVTEHDIIADAWYLDCGRIPTCIAVEAGQADLFLSGWLGIDFESKGLAVYRLLDAVVTIHDALPGPGATIHYDIRINNFFRQGETWLFRFEFDATVNGRPLLTMRDGCAGFFSEEELAGGKGIVHTALDLQPQRGKRPEDWSDPVPMTVESFSDDQLTALRRGDLEACFGSPFRGLSIANPVTIPDGRMRLVDRVLKLDPSGGKYGLGLIRAEADIHPDDWFLTCHFCDDQVMPGTLMYECCLHTLRVYLLRMGWIGAAGDIAYEPIPDVRSRLKCRGQVLATTKKVWYEVTLKEIGYGGENGFAYCLADALMYADGKPIVEMTDMSVRLTGLTREKVERLWSTTDPSGGRESLECGVAARGTHNQGANAPRSEVLFNVDRITEFAIGKPSLAFGDKYRVFDEGRVIARLPGPPFQFLDRITSIQNCEQWKLASGGVIVAEYDVPPDAWYFDANRQRNMPFAVLLEAALQPCGWLAAYLGSALTSDVDLSFRNLGGKATQLRAVTSESGTLTTTVKITSVSQSAGMIIQHYSFDLRCRGEPIYQGTTYFGFFSKTALANQIGIRDAAIYQPSDAELRRAESFTVPHEAPFPSDRFRMVDRVAIYIPDGGPHSLGFLRGTIDVDPAFWFFKAHFYQDPVWPGSLGLESFLQLMKVYAAKRWGDAGGPRSASDRATLSTPNPQPTTHNFQTVALNAPHEWVYRGQVIPQDKTVTVDVVITAVDDAQRLATATGFLTVDGRVIYQMIDFTAQFM